MAVYPAKRYSVLSGELADRTINGPDEESPNWLPSPHKFRATTVGEFLHHGKDPVEAERLYKRELRRVKLIFAGVSVADAEKMADEEGEISIESLIAANAELQKKYEDALAETSAMRASFEAAYSKLKQENAAIQAKLARKDAKSEPDSAK